MEHARLAETRGPTEQGVGRPRHGNLRSAGGASLEKGKMNTVFQHSTTPLEPGITVIAASAGTGKTFTLAALVTRLVAELGIPIQRLLLTTYTVAATAELRDRIRVRLIAALDAVKRGDADGD